MTEKEWERASDPGRMLRHLGDGASQRKLRLFAVACCRRIWTLIGDGQARNAVAIAELFADGWADQEQLEVARDAAMSVALPFPHDSHELAASAARQATWHPLSRYVSAADAAYNAVRYEAFQQAMARGARQVPAGAGQEERYAQAHLVRDFFGNPFRSLPVPDAWLTPTVKTMARVTYQERRFADLPILADVLEEVGCDNADVLSHCRQPGEHARGCWLVDLLLGRERGAHVGRRGDV